MNADFFDEIRDDIFDNSLNQAQVDGINLILDWWYRIGTGLDNQLAYVLATIYHETAGTMQPIMERGGVKYFTRLYDVQGKDPARAKRNGNIHPGDGARFCGRGHVMITWRNNYRRLGKRLGIPLEQKPHLAMKPDISAQICIYGMLEGLFSGRALGRYVNEKKSNFKGARYVVNGSDKASDIAVLAESFLDAIEIGNAGGKLVPVPKPKPRMKLPDKKAECKIFNLFR